MELEGFDVLSEFGKANTHIKNAVLARVWIYCWSFKSVLCINSVSQVLSSKSLESLESPGTRVDPSPTAGLAVSAQPDALPGTETLSHLTFWFALCTLMTVTRSSGHEDQGKVTECPDPRGWGPQLKLPS